MKLKIRLCSIVESHHKKSTRAYAHYGHKKNTICISREVYKLPLNHSIALIAHEVGHNLAEGGSEEEANQAAKKYTEASIHYISITPWGSRLQYIRSDNLERVFKRLKIYVNQSSLKSFRLPR